MHWFKCSRFLLCSHVLLFFWVSNSALITIAEAYLLVVFDHWTEISDRTLSSVCYVEDMLRTQLTQAVGRTLVSIIFFFWWAVHVWDVHCCGGLWAVHVWDVHCCGGWSLDGDIGSYAKLCLLRWGHETQTLTRTCTCTNKQTRTYAHIFFVGCPCVSAYMHVHCCGGWSLRT